jgi:hypothetical protein
VIVALGAAALALSASPERLELAPGVPQVVRLAHAGAPLAVRLSVTGLAVDLRGRSRVTAASDAARWLRVSPARLVVGPLGATARVVARVPRGARPGDHTAVVLVTAKAPGSPALTVRLRVGLIAVVRVPGRIVHRLEVRAARLRRVGRARFLELAVVNGGNVVEPLRGAVRVRVSRGGRVVAVLRPDARDLLPHARGLLELRYRGRGRGPAVVRVDLPRGRFVRFHLRL